MDKIDRAYKSIGEFVVTFQWIENTYRQIGWFILDPEHKNWPPRALRKEKNWELLEKVTNLFQQLVDTYDLPGAEEKIQQLLELTDKFRILKDYRNSLLHSVFVELKSDGEVVGILRSDPKWVLDSETGKFIEHELFTEELVLNKNNRTR